MDGLLALAALDGGMLGIGDALKQAVQEALFWLARTFWVSFLTLELYILKPLVLQTPVPTEFMFFSGHEDYVYYDPQISGPDGIIHQFYEKTAALAGFAMTLGLVFSGFMLGMGITSDSWLATAKQNLRRLVFMAPFIYLSIYMLQFVAELSAMTTSFFLDAETYDNFLIELPNLIFNPGTPKFSDEVGLIIGLAMTSVVLFLVLLELVARFAVMVFIPAISPLLFCLLIFNWSRPMAQSALKLYVTAAFFQPALAICLNFTLTLVLAMRSNSAGTVAPWAMLAGCAALMAYLPKVLSGTGNQLSQAASGIKTAAVATVATVAVSTGAGVAMAGKLGASGAAMAAGGRGGFGAATSAASRGGNWVARAGWRQAQFGSQQMVNLGKEAFGMGGLTKLPHDDLGYPGRGSQLLASRPTSSTGAATGGAAPAAKPLDRVDRAAFEAGASLRRRWTGEPQPPSPVETTAAAARTGLQLHDGLAQLPRVPGDVKRAARRAQVNPRLAGHVDRALQSTDTAGFQAAYVQAMQDPTLNDGDQKAFQTLARTIAPGRAIPDHALGVGPLPLPRPGEGKPFAGPLAADASRLLQAQEHQATRPRPGGDAELSAQSRTLGRRAVYAAVASTGGVRVAQDLAAESWDSPHVQAEVEEAARRLATLNQAVVKVQRASHSTMEGASIRTITPRQPASVRQSIILLGREDQLAGAEPFLRQVEAGKYNAEGNLALDQYLQAHPEVVKDMNLPSPSGEHLNREQAQVLLERIQPSFTTEIIRTVLKQIVIGDQDNASVRAYRTIQAEITGAPAPASADLRVVAALPRAASDAVADAGGDSRADVEQALASIRQELAAGAPQQDEDDAYAASAQALRAASYVDRHAQDSQPRARLK